MFVWEGTAEEHLVVGENGVVGMAFGGLGADEGVPSEGI